MARVGLHTIGSDGTSPHAVAQANELNKSMVGLHVDVRPFLRVENWNCCFFIMQYWRPAMVTIEGRALAAVQRDEWHTTLVKAYWPEERFLPWRTLGPDPRATFEAWRRHVEVEKIARAVQPAYRRHLTPVVGQPLLLAPSPWRCSWTFGVGEPWHAVLASIEEEARPIVYAMGLRLRKHRDLHISWR